MYSNRIVGSPYSIMIFQHFQIVHKPPLSFELALTVITRCVWCCGSNCCWNSRSSSSSSSWCGGWASLIGITTVAFFTKTRGPLIGYYTKWVVSTDTWTWIFALIAKACLFKRTVRIKKTSRTTTQIRIADISRFTFTRASCIYGGFRANGIGSAVSTTIIWIFRVLTSI